MHNTPVSSAVYKIAVITILHALQFQVLVSSVFVICPNPGEKYRYHGGGRLISTVKTGSVDWG